jgi:hypothetical protein
METASEEIEMRAIIDNPVLKTRGTMGGFAEEFCQEFVQSIRNVCVSCNLESRKMDFPDRG